MNSFEEISLELFFFELAHNIFILHDGIQEYNAKFVVHIK